MLCQHQHPGVFAGAVAGHARKRRQIDLIPRPIFAPEPEFFSERAMGTTHQLILGQAHASHPLLDDLYLVPFRVVRGASESQLPFADLETFGRSVFDEGEGLKRLCR